MPTFTITTLENILLRPTLESDLDFVLQTENAPENASFVTQWTQEQHSSTFVDPDIFHSIIMDVEENKKIGYAIIAGLKDPHKSIELRRIVITEKEKGYGRKVLNLVKKWAFEECKAHRLWLDVRSHNQRAKHLYISVGFVEEGLLRECVLVRGKYESIYIMSILEDEYFK